MTPHQRHCTDTYKMFPMSEHGKAIDDHFQLDSDEEHGFLPKKTLILCFTNRCGSTLLASLLSLYGVFGKPNKQNNFEYFNSDAVIDYSRTNSIASMSDYIRSIMKTFTTASGFFSTKLSLDQLVWMTKRCYLRRHFINPIFIYVVRRNVVAQAISLSIALQTHRWTSLHK